MSPPPGGGVVACVIAAYWPELEPATLDDIAQLHQSWAEQLDEAADKSDTQYKPLFNKLFQGRAGEKLQTALGSMANRWRNDADEHTSAAAAVHAAAGDLEELRNELTGIITADEPAYDAAVSRNDHKTANQVLADAESTAKTAAVHYAGLIHSALNGRFGTAPASTDTGGAHAVLTSELTGGAGIPGVNGAGDTPTSAPGNVNGLDPDPTSTTGPGQTQPVPAGTAVATPGSSGPISSGASTPASSSTVPASATPAAGMTPAPGGAGSGSDVASAVGSSGAPSATMVSPQMLGQAQPGLPAPARRRGGKADAATSSAASDLSAPPAGAGGDAGDGAVMPTSPAPGPLAPYSPSAAGLSSPAPPGSTPAAPSGPPPGPSAGGGGAVVTGTGGADRPVRAAPGTRVNPDKVSAQRVLAGLVKACPARPISWAVSVLRTPVGPQTLIAGSVGGGAYLPPEVSVPSTVGLAVLDPALPSDWAAAWMGWQSPLAILVDHYERISKVVAGVTVSAMITSELWPNRPGCGGDFSAVRHEELVMSTAAPLAGGHRLSATDPALATRLTALDSGGDVTNFVAAQLTRAVWTAAAQPDDTGAPIAVQEDADILALVASGAARAKHWDNYRRDVECRADGAVTMPEIHAPRDADDSAGSVTARMWYRHFYARGRVAEMVSCWASQPVSILDIAYCGVAAGFAAVIAALVTELEQQVSQEMPGRAGGTR